MKHNFSIIKLGNKFFLNQKSDTESILYKNEKYHLIEKKQLTKMGIVIEKKEKIDTRSEEERESENQQVSNWIHENKEKLGFTSRNQDFFTK